MGSRSKWGQIKIQENPLFEACDAITKFCSDPFCVASGARGPPFFASKEHLAPTSRFAPERVPWAFTLARAQKKGVNCLRYGKVHKFA